MGIIKTAAKVAVASSIHGRVQRRQQRRWAAEDQRAMAEPRVVPVADTTVAPTDRSSGRISQLKELGELRDSGVLTGAEFEAEKSRILRS